MSKGNTRKTQGSVLSTNRDKVHGSRLPAQLGQGTLYSADLVVILSKSQDMK